MDLNPAEELYRRTTDAINHGFDRFSRIVDEVTAGKYSPTKLISDNAKTWIDVASVWLFPLEQALELLKNRNYVVRIPILTTDDTGAGAADIPNLGVFPVVSGDLALLSDATIVIPHANVTAQIVSAGEMIVVNLFDLQTLSPPPQEGTYHGQIFRTDLNEPTLISVVVDVDPVADAYP